MATTSDSRSRTTGGYSFVVMIPLTHEAVNELQRRLDKTYPRVCQILAGTSDGVTITLHRGVQEPQGMRLFAEQEAKILRELE